MAGFFSKKQYAAIAERAFARKLLKDLCLECSIWAIFFSSSFTVSMTALFRMRILSFIFISTFFMLFLILEINWIPFRNKVSNKVFPMYPLSAHNFPLILFKNEPCFNGSLSSTSAGVNSAEELEKKSFYDTQKSYIDENGIEIDMSDMQCLVVNNNCMRKRNIKNGDRLLAQKIDIFRSVYEQINVNDILWINIADTGKNKIRVLESINKDGYLTTFYYDDNGEKKYSSRPHAISSIRGIVRFNLSL